MQNSSADRDFAAYNIAQQGRPVRPLAKRAVELCSARRDRGARVAVELGSGLGVEAEYLAAEGFHVSTYDVDPGVEAVMLALAESHLVRHRTARLEELTELPDADLILSCATLSFVPDVSFARLWQLVRDALRPRGVLAVDLFGQQDEWAGSDGFYPTRAELDDLLVGLEVIALEEREYDGRSFAGPKHWHTFQVIARRR